MLSFQWGWGDLHHYPSGLWHIFQIIMLDLRYITIMIINSCFSPEMIMCCPIAPGPAKWPRRVPPENISEAEVGSSSEMRTSTFRVRSPQQSKRLKISTLWTETEVPKSMANQGVASPSVWQTSPSIIRPSIQLPALNVWNMDDWVAVTGCSCSPGNCSPVRRICTKQRRWRKWRRWIMRF